MLFDIAAVAFILLVSLYMMKKGGAKAILSLFSLVLSIAVAMGMYPHVSEFLYETPFPEAIESSIEGILVEKSLETVTDVATEMPDFIANHVLMTLSGDAEEIAREMANSITKTVVDIITFVLVLIVTRLILWLLSGILNLLTKIPLVKQANALVGFLCGAGVGYLIVCVAVYVLSAFAVGNETLAGFMDGSYMVGIITNTSHF